MSTNMLLGSMQQAYQCVSQQYVIPICFIVVCSTNMLLGIVCSTNMLHSSMQYQYTSWQYVVPICFLVVCNINMLLSSMLYQYVYQYIYRKQASTNNFLLGLYFNRIGPIWAFTLSVSELQLIICIGHSIMAKKGQINNITFAEGIHV